MITRSFRNGSVLVRISLLPYKYVPIYLYICYGYVLDAYPHKCTIVENVFYSNSLEFWLKVCSVWVCLSNRVSFVLVGACRMPRRCVATEMQRFVIENLFAN